MALIVGGTAVTGTQTLDATKLTGNLPALDGGSLTNVGLAAINFVAGNQLIPGNTDKNITAPNPGVAFGVGGPSQSFKSGSNGQTINLRNTANGQGHYSHWVTIAG